MGYQEIGRYGDILSNETALRSPEKDLKVGAPENQIVIRNDPNAYRILDLATDIWADSIIEFDQAWSTAGITTNAVLAAYDGSGGNQDYVFLAGPHRGTQLGDSAHLSLGIANTTFETRAWLEADELYLGISDDSGETRAYGVMLGSNGSAAAPFYGFGSDPDTGIYLAATGQISWSSAGVYQGSFMTGLVVGEPTGGAKGKGTVNIDGDYYINGTAHTHDWVFELAATGKITKFKDDLPTTSVPRLIPLDELDAYVKKHWHLPGISDEPRGIGGESGINREWIERHSLYLVDHEERLKELEAA